MGEPVVGRAHEHDQPRPAPGDVFRRLGKTMLAAGSPSAYWPLPGVSKDAIRIAAEHQLALRLGREVGLADDDTREVIRVWSQWWAQWESPLDWGRVREAVVERAAGREWRPLTDEQVQQQQYRERVRRWAAGWIAEYWLPPPQPATMDTARITRARRVHAAYDRRRLARARRRRVH